MIRLTKIDINPASPVIQSKTVDEYLTDQERGTWGLFFEGKSPPVDYWVEGELIHPIEVGKSILLDRHNRNGVEIRGLFHTSVVESVETSEGAIYAQTRNSLYKIEQA